MEQIRVITSTTDGKHIGTTFDLSQIKDRIEIDGCVFKIINITSDKLVSPNYIIEFMSAKGT